MSKSESLLSLICNSTAMEGLADLFFSYMALKSVEDDPHAFDWQVGLPGDKCWCGCVTYRHLGFGLATCAWCDIRFIDPEYHKCKAVGVYLSDHHISCGGSFVSYSKGTHLYVCHACGLTFINTKYERELLSKLEKIEGKSNIFKRIRYWFKNWSCAKKDPWKAWREVTKGEVN